MNKHHGLVCLALVIVAAVPASAVDLVPSKEAAVAAIEAHRGELVGLSDQVWAFAETALREHRSAALLADYLEANGFAVERGVAGMPTAFVASYGEGEPVIAYLEEYDELIGLSQKAVSHREQRDDPAIDAGHGCGRSDGRDPAVRAHLAPAARGRARPHAPAARPPHRRGTDRG